MTPSPLDGAGHPLPEGPALALVLRAERARLEHHPGAASAWAAATRAFEEVGRPYVAAYTRLREAEVQVLTKQTGERPVAAVRSAHGAARDLGARRLQAEVELLARWGRVDLVPTTAGSSAAEQAGEQAGERAGEAHPGLTPREVEVLEGLMAGRTNREIGEHLFISVKTVSVHVSNILRKQGVASREEAARLGHRARAASAPAPTDDPTGDPAGDRARG